MTNFFNENIRRNAKSYIMIFTLLVIGIIFTVLTDGIFVTPRNISMLARQTTVVGIISIGMMFVILAAHIDLSVGALLGACGTIAGALQVWGNWGTYPTIIAVVIFGLVIGAWNGFWVAYRKVPAFIATLGTMLICKGIKLGIGKGRSIAPMNESFSYFGQSYLSTVISWIIAFAAIVFIILFWLKGRESKKKYNIQVPDLKFDFVKIAVLSAIIVIATTSINAYQGIPVPVVILIVLAIIFNFIANSTTYGRSVYTIGGNNEAAVLAGIKTKQILMRIFIIAGGLAAIAGIVLTARMDSATAAAGDGMELDAIASCVIGGVSLTGGSGRISGVIAGALIMASLDNGMSLINLESFWQFIVKGLVLILAVWADMALKNK